MNSFHSLLLRVITIRIWSEFVDSYNYGRPSNLYTGRHGVDEFDNEIQIKLFIYFLSSNTKFML